MYTGDHRGLHSFPTRRSSDLRVSTASPAIAPPIASDPVSPMKILAGDTGSLAIRSEEHTSELQSHVNLVCRLLLEKKKKALSSAHSRRPHPDARERRVS